MGRNNKEWWNSLMIVGSLGLDSKSKFFIQVNRLVYKKQNTKNLSRDTQKLIKKLNINK